MTGDPPSVRDHLQHIDIASLVAPTGAGYERVYRPETAVDDFHRAVWRVHSERRPFVLNVPLELLRQEFGDVKPPRTTFAAGPHPIAGAEAIDEAIGHAKHLGATLGVVDANTKGERSHSCEDSAEVVSSESAPNRSSQKVHVGNDAEQFHVARQRERGRQVVVLFAGGKVVVE